MVWSGHLSTILVDLPVGTSFCISARVAQLVLVLETTTESTLISESAERYQVLEEALLIVTRLLKTIRGQVVECTGDLLQILRL